MKALYTNGGAPSNPPAISTKAQNRGARRAYRSARRHFHNGQRTAVRRALTGAKLYLNGEVPTLEAAAVSCGSNGTYITAMITVVKAESSAMLMNVLAGIVPLLTAAKQLKQVAKLVAAYRGASANERVTFGKTIGVDAVWDNVVSPAL
jgi:hypothetical protein